MININTKCLGIETICAIILAVLKNIALELSPKSAHYFRQSFSQMDAQDLPGCFASFGTVAFKPKISSHQQPS
jgi:hypothetical protein